MDSKIKIKILGGVQEYGKNMYCIEDDDNIIVIDAGVKFPEFGHFGIEKIISNFDYLMENKHKLRAIFISHVHEENVGSLEYLLKRLNVVVYLSKFSKMFLESYLPQFKGKYRELRNEIKIGTLKVNFYELPHTIYGNCGILINTPQGAIIYDGDSSFESFAIPGFNSQLSELIYQAKSNKKGVLALFLNARNARSHQSTFNNANTIKKVVSDVFYNKTGKLFVVAHSEDLLTLKLILDQAYSDGLKVYINSYKLFHYMQTAKKLGLLTNINELITTDYSEIEEKNGVIILGENENKLFTKIKKITTGEHPLIKLYNEDSIFVSCISNILNEGEYQKETNMLYNYTQNITIVSKKDILAPYMTSNELKLFVNLFNPKYVIVRNGEYRELVSAKNSLIESLNIDENNVLVLNNGNHVSFVSKKIEEINYKKTNFDLYIENGRYGDTENRVLSDRERFSESGMLVVNLSIKRNTNKIASKPKFISYGLLEEKHKKVLNTKLNDVILEFVKQNQESNIVLRSDDFKQEIYRICAKVLRKQYNQQPQIFVIIMEL